MEFFEKLVVIDRRFRTPVFDDDFVVIVDLAHVVEQPLFSDALAAGHVGEFRFEFMDAFLAGDRRFIMFVSFRTSDFLEAIPGNISGAFEGDGTGSIEAARGFGFWISPDFFDEWRGVELGTSWSRRPMLFFIRVVPAED